MQTFYVTTPIYYVNDKPHIGHAYTTILADVLARYHRLMKEEVFFLTGTDEHGQKVQQAAAAAGMECAEQADRTVGRFVELWQRLEITNNDFLRTTEERHKRVVRSVMMDLHARGEIYDAEYDGWYCVPCERFFVERDLQDGKCPECRRAVECITERNYFFRMSAYRDWLVDYIQQYPEFIQPGFRRNETLGFLRQDLNDLCISRPKSRLSWGIELPFDPDYVTYVWFDALLNYISAPGYGDDEKRFNKWWPADMHLIGKDILTTHTVYWPIMLKAIGLPLPRTVFAHGWWLTGRDKMSKSAGNVVDPLDLVERVGVDAFRYFLMAEMTIGQDASFTEDIFVRRYNADLANDLGNLLSRVVKIIATACGGKIPAPGTEGEAERALGDRARNLADRLEEYVNALKIDALIAHANEIVRETNRYIEQKQPWLLAKQEQSEELGTVLYTAAETLRVVSGMLFPVMPGKMGLLLETLGLDRVPLLEDLRRPRGLKPGAPVGATPPLFPRLRRPENDKASGAPRSGRNSPPAT